MFFSVRLNTVQGWGSRKGKSTGKITLELNSILQIETQHTLDLVSWWFSVKSTHVLLIGRPISRKGFISVHFDYDKHSLKKTKQIYN